MYYDCCYSCAHIIHMRYTFEMSYEFMHTFFMTQKNKLKFFKNKKNKMCGVVSQSSSSNSEWASWSGSLQFIFSIERERGKNSLWLLHQHFVCHVLLLFHSKKKKSLPLTFRVDAKSTHFGLYAMMKREGCH